MFTSCCIHMDSENATIQVKRHPAGKFAQIDLDQNMIFATDEQMIELRDKINNYLLSRHEEVRKVADPEYVPTLEETMRHPDAFAEGMMEQTSHRR